MQLKKGHFYKSRIGKLFRITEIHFGGYDFGGYAIGHDWEGLEYVWDLTGNNTLSKIPVANDLIEEVPDPWYSNFDLTSIIPIACSHDYVDVLLLFSTVRECRHCKQKEN